MVLKKDTINTEDFKKKNLVQTNLHIKTCLGNFKSSSFTGQVISQKKLSLFVFFLFPGVGWGSLFPCLVFVQRWSVLKGFNCSTGVFSYFFLYMIKTGWCLSIDLFFKLLFCIFFLYLSTMAYKNDAMCIYLICSLDWYYM